MSVGADGSIYAAGNFSGTASFGSGPSATHLTSAGADDVYVSKLDAAGNFVWVKSFGGPGYDEFTALPSRPMEACTPPAALKTPAISIPVCQTRVSPAPAWATFSWPS